MLQEDGFNTPPQTPREKISNGEFYQQREAKLQKIAKDILENKISKEVAIQSLNNFIEDESHIVKSRFGLSSLRPGARECQLYKLAINIRYNVNKGLKLDDDDLFDLSLFDNLQNKINSL